MLGLESRTSHTLEMCSIAESSPQLVDLFLSIALKLMRVKFRDKEYVYMWHSMYHVRFIIFTFLIDIVQFIIILLCII